MKTKGFTILILLIFMSAISKPQGSLPYNDLDKKRSDIVVSKGTEAPFTGKFEKYGESGGVVSKGHPGL